MPGDPRPALAEAVAAFSRFTAEERM